MRGFNDFLRAEVKADKVGVTLLNPGQIRGTRYLASNHVDLAHLPFFFGLGLDNPRAYDCGMVATRALQGVEDGECEVHVPGPVVHSLVSLAALAPSLVWWLVDLAPPPLLQRIFLRSKEAKNGAADAAGADAGGPAKKED